MHLYDTLLHAFIDTVGSLCDIRGMKKENEKVDLGEHLYRGYLTIPTHPCNSIACDELVPQDCIHLHRAKMTRDVQYLKLMTAQ